MLPVEDKTPSDWALPLESTVEVWLKKPLRWILYPTYLSLINPFLRKRFDPFGRFGADQWYWGQRGFEYEFLRTKVERFTGIQGKSILIAGCGSGRDLSSWIKKRPSRILGVDYFNYHRAWEKLAKCYGDGRLDLSFTQGSLDSLGEIKDDTFDIVGSDAVLEHLRDLPKALKEMYRVLKPGGILYAAYGPLWYCWGGDHISGYNGISSGYNHLVLDRESYEHYLNGAGPFSPSQPDGRLFIQYDLFSYFRPTQYLATLQSIGFERDYLGMVVEPRALRCLHADPKLRNRLMVDHDLIDLIIKAMNIIYRKPTPSL